MIVIIYLLNIQVNIYIYSSASAKYDKLIVIHRFILWQYIYTKMKFFLIDYKHQCIIYYKLIKYKFITILVPIYFCKNIN